MAWIDDLYSRIADFREVIGIKLNYLYENKEDIVNKQDNLLSADPLHYPNVPAVRNGINIAIEEAIDDLNLDLDTRYIQLSEKGVANGVATLDGSGHVPAEQLPGFVDDVIDLVDFVTTNPTSGMTVGQKWYNTVDEEIYEATSPTTGITYTPVSDAIYVNTQDNTTWRWTGTTMIQMNGGLVLGETSSTAYRGDRGKIAYDHTFIQGNPHNTQISDIPGLTADLDGKANIRLDNLPSNLSGAEQTSIRTKLGVGTGNGSLNTVGVVMPVSFVVTNSPLTGTGGTITITIASGYIMPTTAQAAEWDEAYDEMHTHGNMTVLNATTAAFTIAQQTKLTNLNIFTISRDGTNIPISSNNIDIPIFSTSGAGLVPNRVGSTTTRFLREDGTWVIPTNTTYTNMTFAELNAGSVSTGRVISSTVLNQWVDGKGFATEAWVTANYIPLTHPVNGITLTRMNQWDAAYTHSVAMGDATQPIPDWAAQLLSMLNF